MYLFYFAFCLHLQKLFQRSLNKFPSNQLRQQLCAAHRTGDRSLQPIHSLLASVFTKPLFGFRSTFCDVAFLAIF